MRGRYVAALSVSAKQSPPSQRGDPGPRPTRDAGHYFANLRNALANLDHHAS